MQDIERVVGRSSPSSSNASRIARFAVLAGWRGGATWASAIGSALFCIRPRSTASAISISANAFGRRSIAMSGGLPAAILARAAASARPSPWSIASACVPVAGGKEASASASRSRASRPPACTSAFCASGRASFGLLELSRSAARCSSADRRRAGFRRHCVSASSACPLPRAARSQALTKRREEADESTLSPLVRGHGSASLGLAAAKRVGDQHQPRIGGSLRSGCPRPATSPARPAPAAIALGDRRARGRSCGRPDRRPPSREQLRPNAASSPFISAARAST